MIQGFSPSWYVSTLFLFFIQICTGDDDSGWVLISCLKYYSSYNDHNISREESMAVLWYLFQDSLILISMQKGYVLGALVPMASPERMASPKNKPLNFISRQQGKMDTFLFTEHLATGELVDVVGTLYLLTSQQIQCATAAKSLVVLFGCAIIRFLQLDWSSNYQVFFCLKFISDLECVQI